MLKQSAAGARYLFKTATQSDQGLTSSGYIVPSDNPCLEESRTEAFGAELKIKGAQAGIGDGG
jgi:hypothetical protein